MSVDEFLDGEFLDDSHEESDSLSQDEGDSDQEENLATEVTSLAFSISFPVFFQGFFSLITIGV